MARRQTPKLPVTHRQRALYPYVPLDPYATSNNRWVRLTRARATRNLRKTSIDDIDVNPPGQPANVTRPLPLLLESPSIQPAPPGYRSRRHSDSEIASPRIEAHNRCIQRAPTAPATNSHLPTPVTRPPSYHQRAELLPRAEGISWQRPATFDTKMGTMNSRESVYAPSLTQEDLGLPIRRATRENTIPLPQSGSELDHSLSQFSQQSTSSQRASSENPTFVCNIVAPSPGLDGQFAQPNKQLQLGSQINGSSPSLVSEESPEAIKFPSPPDQFPKISPENVDPESQLETAVSKWEYFRAFLFENLPRQIYMLFLLFSPRVYFSRVTAIFVDAEMTLQEIKDLALKAGIKDSKLTDEQMSAVFKQDLPKSSQKLKQNWEVLIDNLLREWKTMNIVSALLLTGILTILQIDKAAEDFYTRYTALFSFFDALISLVFGCAYIVQFATMRKMQKGAEWVIEAINEQTIFWNVWVMLALPSAFLAWSMLLFTASILCFMWRVSYKALDNVTAPPVPDTLELITRIAICLLLGLGFLYGIRVVMEFQHYGKAMDEKWRKRIEEYIQAHAPEIKTSGNQDLLQQGYVPPQTVENRTTGTPDPVLLAPSQSFTKLPTSGLVKQAYLSKLPRELPERLSSSVAFSSTLKKQESRG